MHDEPRPDHLTQMMLEASGTRRIERDEQTVDASAIDRGSANLAAAIDGLDSLLALLRERLSPVLHEALDGAEASLSGAPTPVDLRSPHLRFLDIQAGRCHRIASDLGALIDRLDI